MAVIRANVANLMKAGLDQILFSPWKKADPFAVINQVFNVSSFGYQYERFMTIEGVPLLSKKDEGTNYSAVEPGEGYYTDLESIAYGVYMTITHEAQADERYSVISRFPQVMREAAEATIQYYASSVFTGGFDSLPAWQSGNRSATEYLFSTSHAMKNGDTQSNKPSTDADLTATSLWAAVNAFYTFKNDAGLPKAISPKILLTPHQLQQKATELLDSDKYPENAENAINALRKRTEIESIIWPYWLGNVDADAWYLLADKASMGKEYPLQFQWREKPRTKMTVEDLSDNLLYFIYERFACGWPDYVGVYGSAGD